jgi:hypothetical protein
MVQIAHPQAAVSLQLHNFVQVQLSRRSIYLIVTSTCLWRPCTIFLSAAVHHLLLLCRTSLSVLQSGVWCPLTAGRGVYLVRSGGAKHLMALCLATAMSERTLAS